MATKIILKKSTTGGSAPLSGDLDVGELAVNLADRKIYAKNGGGTIITLNGAYVDSTAPGNPQEGDLWYDSTNNTLKSYNGSVWAGAGYSTLGALEDVTIDTIASGEILKWNGSAWVNNTLAEAGIQPAGSYASATHTHSISDVTGLQTALDGKSSTSHNHTLESLSDTTITSIASGELLKWNGTAWVNNTIAEAGIQPAGSYAAASHTHTLDSLSNTTITSIASGEILKWDGTAWVNNTLAEAGIAASSHTHALSAITDVTATAAEVNVLDGITATTAELNYTDGVTSNIQTQLNGKASTSHNHTLDSLSDTTITANSSGEILKWNGTAWVNNTLAEAGIQPAGSYLTSESDTLATVTARGATTSNAIGITNNTASSSTSTGALTVTGGVGIGGALNVGGNTIITGNLTVNGTTTTVNSNTVNIGDNIIVLNADETGVPSQDGGIEIERGTSSNVSFLWVEASDHWSLGNQTLADVTLDGGSY
jgi:hypothetical protein